MQHTLSRRFWIIGLACAAMLSSCAKISGLDELGTRSGTGGMPGNGDGGNAGGATSTEAAGTTGGTPSNGDGGNTGGVTNTGGVGTTTGEGCNAIDGGYSEGDIRLCSEGGLFGPCANGNQACRKDGTWSPCTIKPKTADSCEAGNDANCNGKPNDGCECIVATTRSCATASGPALGNCSKGQQICGSDGTYGPCSVQVQSADTCDEGDDANCNGKPNEGCSCINGHTENCGNTVDRGICHHGVRTCQNGLLRDCTGSVGLAARDCRSSADNDCDGLPDNSIDTVCQCKRDSTQDCETHPGLDGKAQCRAGTQTCLTSTNGASSSWGECAGSVGPGTEVCDGATDENCDGFVDEGCSCSGNGGPAMVRLPWGYCIDATEVTRLQYAAWLATNPALPAATDVVCGWNATYIPIDDWSDPMGTRSNYPVAYVDWCDAFAYCSGVGKRLCGAIRGGSNAYDFYANATTSQWYGACSSGGTWAYPYEDLYYSNYCNGGGYLGENTVAVGSLSDCVASATGYAGVYDLSGNVWEWEDSCNGTGQFSSCRVRGGSFRSNSDGLKCGSVRSYPRDGWELDVGFRCCSP